MNLNIQYFKPQENVLWTDSKEVEDKRISKKIISVGCFNQYFDHIYILNKLNDHESWFTIVNTIKEKSVNIEYYSRFPLIKENNETINKEWESGYNRFLNLSEFCWIKTFGNLIELAKKNNNQTCLVIIDSVKFHQNSNKLLEKIRNRLKNNWDVIYLGAIQKYYQNIAKDIVYKANDMTLGYFALAIRNNLFQEIINFCKNPNKNMETFMNSIKQNYTVYVSNPNIIINPNEKISYRSVDWNLESYITQLTKSTQPLISVIMTAHNSEKWILFSMESVLNQTYQNIELIIIDDNSSDSTKEIIKKYQQVDDRIRLIENTQNYGTYISKNIGIKQSRGYWITFQDSDDYSMLNRLELQLSKVKDGKHMVCYGKYLAKNNKMAFCEITMFMRRDCVDYIGYFDSVRFGADTEYRMRLTTLNVPIYYMEKYLYTRLDRLMEGNSIGNKKSLTNSKQTSLNSTIRFIYRQSFQCYHKLLKTQKALKSKKYYMDFPLDKRQFEILYNGEIDKNIIEVKLSRIDNYLYKVKL